MAGELVELLQLPFIQRMFIAGFLASISCGIIGSYVVVKRIVFVSGGIAHTTFGGIGFAYYLQDSMGWMWVEPLFGALIFALGATFILGSPLVRNRIREDSTIGVLWVVGMALGILFIHAVDRSKILVQDPVSILFGNILLIKLQDLYLMVGLVIAIVSITVLLYRDLQILTFDEEFARISGINVNAMNLLLLVLVALTTVVLIKVVGVILVIAMLTIPAAISSLFTHNLKMMMVLAVVIGIITTFGGSLLSLNYDLPPGAIIVLLMGSVFVVSLLGKSINQRICLVKNE